MSLEGQPAIPFTLYGSDGKEHSPEKYRGKIVILYFYPKDNTPGCTKEACGFKDMHPDFTAKDVVIFGVSKDSLASHDKFISLFTLPFILLSDPGASVMKSYGAFGEKTMYGKKVEGVIRSTVIIGKDGVILKHWNKVAKAETHPRQVLDWLVTNQL